MATCKAINRNTQPCRYEARFFIEVPYTSGGDYVVLDAEKFGRMYQREAEYCGRHAESRAAERTAMARSK